MEVLGGRGETGNRLPPSFAPVFGFVWAPTLLHTVLMGQALQDGAVWHKGNAWCNFPAIIAAYPENRATPHDSEAGSICCYSRLRTLSFQPQSDFAAINTFCSQDKLRRSEQRGQQVHSKDICCIKQKYSQSYYLARALSWNLCRFRLWLN